MFTLLLIASSFLGQHRPELPGTYTTYTTPGYELGAQIYTIESTVVDQVITGRVFLKVGSYYLIEKGKGTKRWKPYHPKDLKKGDKIRLSEGEWLK